MPAGYVDISLTQKSPARHHEKKLAGMTGITKLFIAKWSSVLLVQRKRNQFFLTLNLKVVS